MNQPKLIALLVGVFVLLILAFSGTFELYQTEQALLLRFGEPVPDRGLVTAPGLHFKMPLIETVVFLDNRILDLELSKQEVLGSDNQRLEVDAFVRYKIADPLKFYQTVGSVANADNQLASVLNSAVRRVLGEASQTQIVRDDRAGLTAKIRDEVNRQAERFGVSINDARIRRVDLPRQISEKVFDRMKHGARPRGRGIPRVRPAGSAADPIQRPARRHRHRGRGAAAGRFHARRRRGGTQPHVRRRLWQGSGLFSFYRSMQAYDTA